MGKTVNEVESKEDEYETAEIISNTTSSENETTNTINSNIVEDEDSTEEVVTETAGDEPSITIDELDFSVRAYNCLKRASINSMAELLKKSEHDLLNIKNFGKKSSDEVIERLHHFGLDLAPNPELDEDGMVIESEA